MTITRQPLTIAHVIYRLDVGGLENGLVNIINRLPSDRYRHQIICLDDYNPEYAKRIQPPVDLYSLHKKPGKDFHLYWRLFKLLRELSPQVVHTRNLGSLDAQWVVRVAVPSSLRVHGLHGWDVSDIAGDNQRYQTLYRWVTPVIHHYIALSNDLESYLTEKVGITGKKITNICNGVDTDRFAPRQDSRRDGLPASFQDEAIVVVGSVGRMEEVKDPLNLVTAFIQLLSADPQLKSSLRLVMIGDGSLRAEIQQTLKLAGVEELAWLPGNRDDVAELMPLLDVFVLPSRAEGISNTILEAMACGLPVVATAVGGNPQLIDDNQTGALVVKEDSKLLAQAILRYATDAVLRREHAQNSRQKALETYSLETMVGKYRKIYDRAAKT